METEYGNKVIVCQTTFLPWVPPFLSYELWKLKIESCKLLVQTGFYQFTNKHHRILFLRHMYLWFVCSLSSLQLVTIWTNVPRLSTKMTNSSRLIMCLALRRVGRLRFRLMKINPNLPRRYHLYRFSLTHNGFDGLTHKGFRRRRRYKICRMGCRHRDAFYKT